MPTKTDGDLLDLDALGDTQMQLPAKNGGFLGGRIALIVAGEEEHGLRESNTDRDATTRRDSLFVRKRRKRLRRLRGTGLL